MQITWPVTKARCKPANRDLKPQVSFHRHSHFLPHADTDVDAHHHLWRKADLPWLSGPMLPRIFGEYEAILRDYLIDEFRQDMV